MPGSRVVCDISAKHTESARILYHEVAHLSIGIARSEQGFVKTCCSFVAGCVIMGHVFHRTLCRRRHEELTWKHAGAPPNVPVRSAPAAGPVESWATRASLAAVVVESSRGSASWQLPLRCHRLWCPGTISEMSGTGVLSRARPASVHFGNQRCPPDGSRVRAWGLV